MCAPGAIFADLAITAVGWISGDELRRGMKDLDRAREIKVRIRRAQRRHRHGAGIVRDKNRRGARGLERRAIFAVHEERQFAGLRFFDSGDAA